MFPTVGYNKVVRSLVDNFIKKIQEKASQSVEPVEIEATLDMKDIE